MFGTQSTFHFLLPVCMYMCVLECMSVCVSECVCVFVRASDRMSVCENV